MSHRTYGETRDCRGCRYWSEMLAQARGGGPVEAMCISGKGPRHGKYVTGRMNCDAWASGDLGAIDEPGDDQTRYGDAA